MVAWSFWTSDDAYERGVVDEHLYLWYDHGLRSSSSQVQHLESIS